MLVTVDDKVCRICLDRTDADQLLTPCHCKGTMAHIHYNCLQRCVQFNGSEKCLICGQKWVGVETVKIKKSLVEYLREKSKLSEFILYSFFMVFAILTLFVMMAPEDFLMDHPLTRHLYFGYTIGRMAYELLIVIGAIFYLCETMCNFIVWRKDNFKLILTRRNDVLQPIL